MKKYFLLLPALLVTLMTGCLKDDLSQGTIVLMGTESDVRHIDSIGIDTMLRFLETPASMHGSALSLPQGNIPPDIQGEYLFGVRELYACNGSPIVANDSLYLRFGGSQGQHNCMVPCDILEKGFEPQHAQAYVKGTGNQFTAYFTVDFEGVDPTNIAFSLKRGYVVTGTIAEEGIENAMMACVNMVVSETISTMLDRIFVYCVKGDSTQPLGTAKRQQWYNNN